HFRGGISDSGRATHGAGDSIVHGFSAVDDLPHCGRQLRVGLLNVDVESAIRTIGENCRPLVSPDLNGSQSHALPQLKHNGINSTAKPGIPAPRLDVRLEVATAVFYKRTAFLPESLPR